MNAAELPYGVPDLMMQELREVRNSLQDAMKPLSPEARQAWLHEQTEKGLSEHGYKLIPHPDRPNAYKVQKIESK